MDKKKIILYTQAILCILWVVLMAAAAISIYRQGTAYQAQGHPEVWIYTREKAVEVFLKLLPLLLLAVAVNIVAVVLKVRDDSQDKPRALPYLTELYKKERAEMKGTDESQGTNPGGKSQTTNLEVETQEPSPEAESQGISPEAESQGISPEGKSQATNPEVSSQKKSLKTDDIRSGKIRSLRIALLVLAIVFLVAGVFNGSMEDMLIKAINICTECVGLG